MTLWKSLMYCWRQSEPTVTYGAKKIPSVCNQATKPTIVTWHVTESKMTWAQHKVFFSWNWICIQATAVRNSTTFKNSTPVTGSFQALWDWKDLFPLQAAATSILDMALLTQDWETAHGWLKCRSPKNLWMIWTRLVHTSQVLGLMWCLILFNNYSLKKYCLNAQDSVGNDCYFFLSCGLPVSTCLRSSVNELIHHHHLSTFNPVSKNLSVSIMRT